MVHCRTEPQWEIRDSLRCLKRQGIQEELILIWRMACMFLNRNALALGTEEQHPEVTKFKITIYKNHRIRMIQAGTPITTNRSKITFQLDGTWPNVCLGRGAELCSSGCMIFLHNQSISAAINNPRVECHKRSGFFRT